MKLLLAGLLLATVCQGGEVRWRNPSERIHQSDLFRMKCNALLYRSHVRDNACYFALNRPVPFSDATMYCRAVIPNSALYTNNDASSVLGAMFLDSSDYHSESTFYSDKKVLCRYVNPFTCNSDERTYMPGRCMKRYEPDMTFREASKICTDRGARLPWIQNDEENGAVTVLASFSSSPAWVDQAVIDNKWKAAVSEPVSFWHWFLDDSNPRLQCSEDIAATVTPKTKGSCVAYSTWEPALWSERRQVICVRPADSAYTPTIKEPPTLAPLTTTTSTTTTSTTTTTTPRTTTTTTPRTTTTRTTTTPTTTTTTTTRTTTTTPNYPKNNPPPQSWKWTLRYYYNWGRILHGFCADPIGCNQMFSNGIGYERSAHSGDVVRTISPEGYEKMKTVCSQNWQRLRPLSMRKDGVRYRYNFDNQGIFVGYVATEKGTCGANYPIWVYSCCCSQDLMYAKDLEGNTFYRGRSWKGPAFVAWWP